MFLPVYSTSPHTLKTQPLLGLATLSSFTPSCLPACLFHSFCIYLSTYSVLGTEL